MSNPFEALNISDDEQDKFTTNKSNVEKTRKTHKERKELKKQGGDIAADIPKKNEFIPERIRDNAKVVRNPRAPRPNKELPEGHVHDRRSGTGRDDGPRKEGGGRGNIGNLKDILHKEKYERPVQQTEEVVEEEPKEDEPQPLTLAEYYESKGLNANQQAPKKVVAKGQVNADWIKKEKLQVIETKEDKRKQEGENKQMVNKQNNTRVEMDNTHSQMLGFGSKPAAQRQPREEEPRDNRAKGGKRTNNKAVVNNDDFPTL